MLCKLVKNGMKVSIHAPRAGSDVQCRPHPAPHTRFNPRSPCGERPGFYNMDCMEGMFQSTLPVRGATPVAGRAAGGAGGFNPRSPCGERPSSAPARCFYRTGFNPRSPCGERLCKPAALRELDVSIHAPRAGSDGAVRRQPRLCRLVSIHAPRAGSDFPATMQSAIL